MRANLRFTDCYKFLISVHDVGGFVETVRYYGHSPTRVSEEEEIKISKPDVKQSRWLQTVRSNLPTELQWMYEDLKMQGL
jgi:hypothetical protein